MATTDLTTYTGLKAAVSDYLGRSDLDGEIPAMIRMCESRINRTLRLRAMEHRAFAQVSAGDSEVPLPERRVAGIWDVFLEMRDILWIPTNGRPVNLTYAPADIYALEMERQGNPLRFTIEGNSLFLLPTPDIDGRLKLTYYAEVEPLSDDIPTNAVLVRYPDLYLYGTLTESAAYTRGSVPVEMWTQYYKTAVDDIARQESTARYPKNIAMRPCRRI